MKKGIFQLIVLFVLLSGGTNAQNLIAIQNGGTPTFYLQLDSAIVHSQNGDTIYIPGGTWWTISQPINKRLHVIGVGHNPDSTVATGTTKITGNISLVSGASNGSLSGLYLAGDILTTGNIVNFSIFRCNLGSYNLTPGSTNWSFIENVIRGGCGASQPGASNCFFSNNLINGGSWSESYGFISSVFKNNILLSQGQCYPYSGCNYPIKASSSAFENNIFISTQMSCQGISNSSLNNNLFVQLDPLPNCSECWGSNNIVNQSQSSIFINQTGNTFNYSHDYHLQSSSPGKNAGTDGTDIGIYGGSFPWKTGSIPFNPHIQYKYIDGATDPNGNLNVNIKVAAQDR